MFLYEQDGKLNFNFDAMKPTEEPEFNLGKEADGTIVVKVGETEIKGETEVNECKIGNQKYATVVAAVAAAQDGDEIVMLRDCEGAGIGLWEATPKDITLNLGGWTYKAIGPAVGSQGTQSQALHLEKGSKLLIKNGTICSAPKATSGIKMLVQNYCDLTLEDVVLDCADNTDVTYVCSNNFGKLTAKGSTQILAGEGKVAFDLWFGMNQVYDDGITVTFGEDFNGIVSGKVEYGAKDVTRVPNWIERTALIIKGGKFIGDVVAGSKNFTFADANIKVYSGADCESTTYDQFRVVE